MRQSEEKESGMYVLRTTTKFLAASVDERFLLHPAVCQIYSIYYCRFRSQGVMVSSYYPSSTHSNTNVSLMALVAVLFTSALVVQSLQPHQQQSRRSALVSVGSAVLSTVTVAKPRNAFATTEEAGAKMKFQRYPKLRFIAALGDPSASSGAGAKGWGLWRDDPGPQGEYLRDYDRKLSATGKAPAGWTLDRDNVWIEEHGLVMPSPGDLPRKSYNLKTKETLDYKRYLVTGAREVTTVLTVHEDGQWELAKGSLYDVTHLPCRSAVYTPTSGGVPGSCVPTANDQASFPVQPGKPMPNLAGQCSKQDYAVLFVLGEEAL